MTDARPGSLGEFYTPRWLAEFVLDQAGYDGAPGVRLLDPSCGPGIFLVLAIGRALRRGQTLGQILNGIQGFERNPDSVRSARANYLAALGALAGQVAMSEVPVFLRDAILEPWQGEPYDLVAGNPPWVRWDHLPPDYRQATRPLWESYGLFSLKGFQARLGGGKKDLSMLFTYVAADRYLRTGGALAFVITQEVFQSKGAGEGFRRFRLGSQGAPLGVRAVHDFVRVRPFKDAANKTAAIFLTKGSETVYPVPYFVWERGANRRPVRRTLQARPLGGPAGPWQVLDGGEQDLVRVSGSNPYRAVLGANANPYGVFWVEVRRALEGGLAEVRNLPEMGKKPIRKVAARIEAGCLYPALRGADIRRWGAAPAIHVLLVQDPETGRGYPEAVLRQRWPRALEYLEGFREELLARALYRKYHAPAARPFYSQFNVGRPALAPFKVVWRRMAADLSAAVVSDWEGPLGRKMLLPLETTAFIGTAGACEAHYLCAVINSTPVRRLVRSFSAPGRGFGTPFVASRIRIPKFDPADATHRNLAAMSRAMHEDAGAGCQQSIDRAVLAL